MTETNYNVIEGRGVPIKIWNRGVPVEESAIEQLRNLSSLPFIHKHIAAMSDCHWGMGATVGSVIATKGAIIPAAVGVDIGCVDAETEYLTPSGWKRIDAYDGRDRVLIYNPALKRAWFERPASHVVRPSSGFNHIKTKYGVNQALSDDHRVLLYEAGRQRLFENYRVESAGAFLARHHDRVLGAGERFKTTPESVACPDAVGYSDAQLRVIVMTAADASVEPASAYLNFRKRRKFDRALELLDAAGVEIVSVKEADGLYGIRYRKVSEIKGLEQLWGASSEQLKVVAEEVIHWDGNADDRVFFTRRKEEADFVQWAFIAAGKRAVLRADEAEDGKVDYRVFAHENTLVGIKSAPRTDVERIPAAEGTMEYCFTVSTGFFLIRRGGVTALTGNCGMMAQRLNLTASDLPDNLAGIRSAIEAAVPHGRTNNGAPGDRGAWGDNPHSSSVAPLMAGLNEITKKHPKLARAAGRMIAHAGTLGTGNHFIELCLDEEQRAWVMLHSGSRGIGNAIGTYFIEKAKEDMRRWFINLPDQDLAYIPQGSDLFSDYWQALGWAQAYARMNREIMMSATLRALARELDDAFAFSPDMTAVNCHHNYVSWENHFGENVMVTRKGAVDAHEGALGIIPGSMGAKSFIVCGKGHLQSFCSCSHGAGRKMSRAAAKRTFTLEDHAVATMGVECRKDEDVIDETPGAYKEIEQVMAAQADLVDVVHTLKQVVCVKG